MHSITIQRWEKQQMEVSHTCFIAFMALKNADNTPEPATSTEDLIEELKRRTGAKHVLLMY